MTRQLSGCFVERINIEKFKKFIIKHLTLYSVVLMAMMNHFKRAMKLPFTRNISMH